MKKTFITPAVNVTAMETQNMILATSGDGNIGMGTGDVNTASNNGFSVNSKVAPHLHAQDILLDI